MRGAQGGWQLDSNWRTQVPGLDGVELARAFDGSTEGDQCGRAGRRASAKLSVMKRALQKAYAKAALPTSLREHGAASIRQRLYSGHHRLASLAREFLDHAADRCRRQAVSSDRKLADCLFASPMANVASAPLILFGLVAKGSAWYLVANAPSGMRTLFRVSRIEGATPWAKEVPCKRPKPVQPRGLLDARPRRNSR